VSNNQTREHDMPAVKKVVCANILTTFPHWIDGLVPIHSVSVKYEGHKQGVHKKMGWIM